MGVSVITIMEVGILLSEIALQIFGRICRVLKKDATSPKRDVIQKRNWENTHSNNNNKRLCLRTIHNPLIVEKYIKNYGKIFYYIYLLSSSLFHPNFF